MSHVHTLSFQLVFPAGIAAGEGSEYNVLRIARNGSGEPVLRGSSLAGVLRHAWMTNGADDAPSVDEIFGFAANDSRAETDGVDSALKVADCRLNIGHGQHVERTHHLRNRHTKSVVKRGLFSLQACPPLTTTQVVLWLNDQSESGSAGRKFMEFVVNRISAGMTFGGSSARGLGYAEIDGKAKYKCYDLGSLDDHAQYFDDHRVWRSSGAMPANCEEIEPQTIDFETAKITLKLGIPRGQDLLIGDGKGVDHEIEPQRVVAIDGMTYWRIPGASLRGALRSWISRLAARDGEVVADSLERLQTSQVLADEIKADDLGWCFLPQKSRFPLGEDEKNPITCPVARLFGSLMTAGRIHIPDCFSPTEATDDDSLLKSEQVRMHVAVDRITGGAAESMLFQNTVLTHSKNLQFEVTILVDKPSEKELDWIRRSIIALDLGVLRMGSSKSSGRLALVESPRITGSKEPNRIADIKPDGWNHAQRS